MKSINNVKIVLILISIVIIGSSAKSQIPFEIQNNKTPKLNDIKSAYDKYWNSLPESQRKGWKQFKRWEHFWETRTMPDGTFPDGMMIYRDWLRFGSKHGSESPLKSYDWQLLGPITSPQSGGAREQGLGRINVIRFDPNNQNIIWAGAATGGVWKSTDMGKTWRTFPFTDFLSIGVSGIAVANSNPNTVYITTGDADGSSGGQSFYTIGMIKTSDGGNSWSVTNLSYYLSHKKLMGKVLVHPDDENEVLVATSDGIFKSTDGGDTFENKLSGSYIIDMEYNPANPELVYATSVVVGGEATIFKSTNGGDNWTISRTVLGAIRIAIEVSYAEPNSIYALCTNQNSGFQAFLKSNDNGVSWTTMSDRYNTVNILGWHDGKKDDSLKGQGHYDLCLAVNPNKKGEVFIGGVNIWKSANDGAKWELVTHWYGRYGKPLVHADQHDLIYKFSNGELFSGNDGGINSTSDGGKTWKNLTDGLSITQFYRIGLSQGTNPIFYGGCQDNGVFKFSGTTWAHVQAGDGMECMVDGKNSQIAYSASYYGNISRTRDGGSNFEPLIGTWFTNENAAWITPMVIDPNIPGTIYVGFVNVWKSTNYGDDFAPVSNISGNYPLQSLAVAPSDSKTLYAATRGLLFATYDGGQNWTDLKTPVSVITYICVDPKNPKRIWITNGGFADNQKVYEYNNDKWLNLSGNLPNVPVNCVVYQNDSPDRLYIGTDIGVFYSDYGSGQWTIFGTGLPNLIIDELEINYTSKLLYAATYGRGIWTVPIMECFMTEPGVNLTGQTEFCQGDSLIIESKEIYQSYLWNTGDTTRSITVKSDGAYSFLVKDNDGCNAKSRAVNVTVYSVPNVTVRPLGAFPICGVDSVNLDLTAPLGFSTYLWSNGE
ncbi:MAG: type sorting protein, partial [Bacteroidota bacterium]|nr:type sorting protein [Bacteroidota bacterium]